MGLNIDFNCQTASIIMKAVLVLSLICVFQISSALINPVGLKRNQEPPSEIIAATCEDVVECLQTTGNMVVAGKYGNVRCVKSPGDGSGVIAADAGIVGTPDKKDYEEGCCPCT